MGRAVLLSCLPWLALLAGASAVLWLLVRLSGAKPDWDRLRRLHGDEKGTVQGLSFVLALSLVFIPVMLLIVQISQLMVATMVVHYAAYTAARSAIVWIPARLPGELENWGPPYELAEGDLPALYPSDPGYGPSASWCKYRVTSKTGVKYEKIKLAAVMACTPISPSHRLAPLSGPGSQIWDRIRAAYGFLAPNSAWATETPGPVYNKLAYAMAHTDVDISFYHSGQEPPLRAYTEPYQHDPNDPEPPEFIADGYTGIEIGWQDPIEVTVTYELKLLPGLTRYIFIRKAEERISGNKRYFVYPLVASATLNNEGEKSAVPYVH